MLICCFYQEFLFHFYHFQVSSSVQSDTQRVFVQHKYPPDKLYKVTTPYTAADSMDISVTEGVRVGLIVDKHPMGNTNRWFVDDGGMYDILGNYGKFSLYFHTVVPPLINPLSPKSTPLINPLSPKYIH